MSELGARCFVIRGLYPENKTVVGIATEIYEQGYGYSMDAIYYSKDDWTEMDKKDFNELKNNLGFFNKPNIKNERVDEYPQ